jgi:hypothetical protein
MDCDRLTVNSEGSTTVRHRSLWGSRSLKMGKFNKLR